MVLHVPNNLHENEILPRHRAQIFREQSRLTQKVKVNLNSIFKVEKGACKNM